MGGSTPPKKHSILMSPMCTCVEKEGGAGGSWLAQLVAGIREGVMGNIWTTGSMSTPAALDNVSGSFHGQSPHSPSQSVFVTIQQCCVSHQQPPPITRSPKSVRRVQDVKSSCSILSQQMARDLNPMFVMP